MKQILLLIGMMISANALAISPISEQAPLPESGHVIMSCEVDQLEQDGINGYYTQEFVSFDIVEFNFYHATIVGKTADGTEYLVSENVDEDIRNDEPMRGFFQLERIMDGESLYLDLWNDSDQPEAELLLNRSSKSTFTGKIMILWDYTQKYSVTCFKR